MIFTAFFIATLLSPFLFAWQYTIALSILASWKYPLVFIIVGIEFDALYMAPNNIFLPIGTIVGVASTACIFFTKYIVKTYVRGV